MSDEELVKRLRWMGHENTDAGADRIEVLTEQLEAARADAKEAEAYADYVTELVGAAEALTARWPADQHSASPLYEEAQRLRVAVAKLKGEDRK